MALVLNSASSQYAEIANGYADLFASVTTSTFSAWFRASSFATQPFIISTKGRSTGSFFVEVNTGTGIYWGTNGSFLQSTNLTLAVDTWHHILVTRGTDGKGRIWINGLVQLVGTQAAYDATGTTLYLGRYDSGLYLPGKLYDLRVWSRTLNPTEIRKVWAGQAISTNLTAWWKLDESSGTTFADSAGSHSGSLFNTPTWDADLPTYGTLDSGESSGGIRLVNVRGGADQ